MRKTILALGVVVSGASLGAVTQAVRNVFLNGVDISGARSQELKNVDLVINEKGDLFIVAPHYQVNEEDTYVPLSKFVQGMNGPKHAPMKELPKPGGEAPMAKGAAPIPVDGNGEPKSATGEIPKAGAPVGASGTAGAPQGGEPQKIAVKPKEEDKPQGEGDEKKEKTGD